MNEILKLNIGIAGCGTMGLPMLEVLLKNKIKAGATKNELNLIKDSLTPVPILFNFSDPIFVKPDLLSTILEKFSTDILF